MYLNFRSKIVLFGPLAADCGRLRGTSHALLIRLNMLIFHRLNIVYCTKIIMEAYCWMDFEFQQILVNLKIFTGNQAQRLNIY